MGVWEKLLGEESDWRKRLRANQGRLGKDFNIAEEIVAAAFSLSQSGREAVLECISTKHARLERNLDAREADLVARERQVQALKKELDTESEKQMAALEFRWKEVDEIQARAFNAIKAAQRVKRKAEKKIADFEALVDR